MTNSKKFYNLNGSKVTRRRFIATAAAATAGVALVPGCAPSDKPNSRFRRVQIGAITYSFRSMPDQSAEAILGYAVDAGLSSLELMGSPIEQYAGIPETPSAESLGILTPEQIEEAAAAAAAGERRFRVELTEDQQATLDAAQEEANAERVRWRLSPPNEKFEELRRMYNDAGVDIHIIKLGSPNWSDDDIDYAFNTARIMGAVGITFEWSDESMLRMGPFSDQHELLAGGHNHTQVGEPGFTWDTGLSFSPYNAMNLDIGHYTAGTSLDVIPIIEQYWDRIISLHLKDRKKGENGGDNLPWGEGETPIAEALNLMRTRRARFTADIELEYPIPEGSDAVAETRKCVEFCRDALG